MNEPYRESVAYLYGLQKHGIKLGLETIETLLSRLGQPQTRYPSVHIGGTNGKGSTAAIAASILQAAGYRTGLYTSPHLVDYRERIRVDGRVCDEAEIVELVRVVRDAAGADLTPTFFEFNTAMAFRAFAEAKVDVAVVEVGMGGRYDATNVLHPLASAITTVALDHQVQLGHTVRAIAFEKAGIIKAGVPVVTGRLDAEADAVVGREANDRRAYRFRLGREFRTEGESPEEFAYHSPFRMLTRLSLPLRGIHQLDNAACAVALLEAAAQGIRLTDQAIRKGLQAVHWEGRLEVAEQEPLLILDGAHNPAAAEVVARHLGKFRRRHPDSRVYLVVGMMRDKDMAGMLASLTPVADHVILTHIDLPRAATVDELRASLPQGGPPVEFIDSVADALDRARRRATVSDLICVTGSLMLVGEVKALLKGCHLSPISG